MVCGWVWIVLRNRGMIWGSFVFWVWIEVVFGFFGCIFIWGVVFFVWGL